MTHEDDEERSVFITVFRDPSGNPTCAADFKSGRVCPFYCTRQFGTFEMCLLDPDTRLERRGPEGVGYLTPGEQCLAWGKDAIAACLDSYRGL